MKALLEKMHDQGRGDVVGEIGHDLVGRHAAGLFGDQCVEIDGQRICAEQVKIIAVRHIFFDNGDEFRIDLDGDDGAGFFGQFAGQRAGAGADLGDDIV